MSGTEAAILASTAVIIWWLEIFRQTLKDCLKAIKENSEEVCSGLRDVQNEIRSK
jgi:hypothetical protein